MPALRAGNTNFHGGIGRHSHGIFAAFAGDVFKLRLCGFGLILHDVFTSTQNICSYLVLIIEQTFLFVKIALTKTDRPSAACSHYSCSFSTRWRSIEILLSQNRSKYASQSFSSKNASG